MPEAVMRAGWAASPSLTAAALPPQRGCQAHLTVAPVIFVTTFPEERSRRRAMNAGAIGFLSKPFNEGALIDCVETALNRVA
jgi:FixJ family two-component response regulator